MNEESDIISPWKDGYKIVERRPGGTLWSCTMYHPAAVQYRLGKETKPAYENGPLAVFDTLEHASHFLACNVIDIGKLDLHIYKCRYRPSVRGTMSFYDQTGTLYVLFSTKFPMGTRLADAVMLTEEITL